MNIVTHTLAHRQKCFNIKIIFVMGLGDIAEAIIGYAGDEIRKMGPNKRSLENPYAGMPLYAGSMAAALGGGGQSNLQNQKRFKTGEKYQNWLRKQNMKMAQLNGTKDMIIGPHRKAKIGLNKKTNVASQLLQMVDDSKTFKQQFKLTVTSGNGIRNWAQIVCRHRQHPGTHSGGTFTPNGYILDPSAMHHVPLGSRSNVPDYYNGLPPVPWGQYSSVTNNYWTFGLDRPDNLLYLNMPLTYLEQDMFNMCLGPGKRDFTQYMTEGRTRAAEETSNIRIADDVADTGDPQLEDPMPTEGIVRDRLTQMMTPIKPIQQFVSFPMEGSQVGRTILMNGHQPAPGESNQDAIDDALNGWCENRAVYPFYKGWGIHHLDYTMIAEAGTNDPNETYPGKDDPQWIKTNNSMNTKATIKHGKMSFTFNNLGETQAYVNLMVVVNKHVDSHYYSMPQALTDQYLKAAQHFIESGEWSITNNIVDTVNQEKSRGDYATAYMHVSHPSIKPFGKVPSRFLEHFNKHFSIKFQSTTKLGLGERQSKTIDLGGLSYTTEQIAMNVNQVHDRTPQEDDQYFPVDPSQIQYSSKAPSKASGMRAVFPLCCQQGTTHVLIGVQGMSLPYVEVPTQPTDPSEPRVVPSVDTTEGRWAAPAIVEIAGNYQETIGPLQTVPKKAAPRQRCITALPPTGYAPVVTTLPRMRTTENGVVQFT